MPNYEYQCKNCGHVFEREHPIGEHKKYKCPDCGSGKTAKLISSVGVIFKGKGFYVTDNRDAGGKVKTSTPATASSNGNGKKDNGTVEKKTETK